MNQTDNIALKGIIQEYKELFNYYFSDSIDKDIISPLVNMLALHYSTKAVTNHKELAQKAIIRLQNYLGPRVIIGYDFSVVLGLFAIAISDNETYTEDITTNLKQAKDQDAIIDQILTDYENDEIKTGLSDLLNEAINSNKLDCILNYVASNKKKTKEIYNKLKGIPSLKKKEDLHREMLDILKQEAAYNQKIDLYKNSAAMVGAVATGALIASGCIFGLGLIAPIAIVPATVYGIKFCSSPLEQITNTIVSVSAALVDRNPHIDKRIERAKHISSPSLSKSQEISVNQNILQEAGKITSDLGIENVNIVKPKKEHSADIVAKAEAIKKNITQRQV